MIDSSAAPQNDSERVPLKMAAGVDFYPAHFSFVHLDYRKTKILVKAYKLIENRGFFTKKQ